VNWADLGGRKKYFGRSKNEKGASRWIQKKAQKTKPKSVGFDGGADPTEPRGEKLKTNPDRPERIVGYFDPSKIAIIKRRHCGHVFNVFESELEMQLIFPRDGDDS
jgi:hypothetical protein